MNSPMPWLRNLCKSFWGKVLFAAIAIPLAIGLAIGVVTLGGHIIKWLWNATVTEIFATNPITFWQALMLVVLFKTLFGSHTNVNQTKSNGLCAKCGRGGSKQVNPEDEDRTLQAEVTNP